MKLDKKTQQLINRLPKTVKVLHNTYKLRFVDRSDDPDWDDDTYGYIDLDASEIVIWKVVSPDRLVDTIFHEVLHGCIDSGNMRVFLKDEERLVQSLTTTLTCLLRDNKELFKCLIKN